MSKTTMNYNSAQNLGIAIKAELPADPDSSGAS